jgi:N-glycosylase/DNA lyase
MTTHEQIVEQFNAYIAENSKFTDKGVKASAARARKALGELGKLSKTRRAEIQDSKNQATS